jgi:citrate lyase subunit beta/citryl-CoA lyase
MLRSLLFVPGNNLRMISKAPSLDADAIILDLEDSVPLVDKETARLLVRDSLRFVKSPELPVYVRTNGMATGYVDEDLKWVLHQGIDGIMLPKCQSKQDILALESAIQKLETERTLEVGRIGILATVETAKGLENVREIAAASKRVFAVGFGAGDYMIDMGGSPYKMDISEDQTEILYPRASVAVAARAASIAAIDTVFFGLLTDRDGFVRECQLARKLGFTGKFLIHPNQIKPANTVFSPSVEDVSHATKMKEAFQQAQSRGAGAAALDGRLIDYASYRMAEEIIKKAAEIGERERARQAPRQAPLLPL